MRGVIAMAMMLTVPVRAETALDAIKELPKEQAGRIARIEAREGTPEPERWYILTQDPAAESGVHEFVVSNGEIVASRAVSQFAESLTQQDMLGEAPLKIDSDKAAKLAQEYAEANGAVVTSMNYELKKDGPDAAPVWTVSCLDEKGNKVGTVVVTAGKGNVVSHDGFALEPQPDATPAPKRKEKEEPRFETYAKPEVTAASSSPAAEEEADDEENSGHHHRHRPPEKQPDVVTRTFKNVGRTLQKYLSF